MYTIGRLGRKARVKADSIRFYERQGLISADSKTPAGYRLYCDAAVRRLLVIKHAQRCGFTLAEIHRLVDLEGATPAARAATFRMLAEKKTEVEATIGALEAMSEALSAVLIAKNAVAHEGTEDLLFEILSARQLASQKKHRSATATKPAIHTAESSSLMR
ncbi:MAG TPA: MerR family DNA-binding protein [Burkholderiales bacterium]|nr:MerR family DNA-binding protein [Burkholderiales bacterium]